MKTIICSVFILLTGSLNAQVATNTEQKDSSNIYYQSFKIFCEKKSEKTGELLLEENNFITKSIPTECCGQKIKIINAIELKEILKTDKQLELIRIVPLRVNSGDFFVNVIVFKVFAKRKQLDFVNIGGVSVVYNYDNNSKSFIYKEIR